MPPLMGEIMRHGKTQEVELFKSFYWLENCSLTLVSGSVEEESFCLSAVQGRFLIWALKVGEVCPKRHAS